MHRQTYQWDVMELTRNLMVESVGRLNPTSPLCVDAGEPVAEAVAVMRRERIGCLLVVEHGELDADYEMEL